METNQTGSGPPEALQPAAPPAPPAQPRAATPRPASRETDRVASEGEAPDGPAGGDQSAGTGPGAEGGADGPVRKKRRRGRRGGRRHKKKPGTAAADAASDSDDDDEDSGSGAEGATQAGTAEPQAARAPRAPRPPRQQQQPRPRRTTTATPRTRTTSTRSDATSTAARAPAEAASGLAAPDGAGADVDAGLDLEPADGAEAAGTPGAEGAPKRRRRRGGRGRRKPGTRTASGEGDAEADTAEAPAQERTPSRTSTRTASPARTGAPERKPAGSSTRLAARAQRQQQRPRRPRRRLSAGEAKALRGEEKTMLIHEHEDRTQIAVLEKNVLIEHYVAHRRSRTMAGNVYLGKVQNVLPGMEAAFVDIGRGRNAVLYAGEVNYSVEDLEGGEAPRIERVLKPGQPVMVQVTKDPLGTKGARLTAQISLAGRYLVLAPEQNVYGISRRLAEDERARLRSILRDIKPSQHGVIVRTAAEGAPRDAIERDLAHLIKIWDEITTKRKKAKAPELLYAEPELVMRVVRDIFAGDFGHVVCDSRGIDDLVREYLEETAPDLLDKLELHGGPLPLFETHHVTEQIHKALERKVWLPSGGSIVIDRTEAMTIIDVNTGKFVGKGGSLEETVLKNNIEAADEVARQLRLRDIGGIIVIDFIDMLLPSNREQVLRTLKRALSRDKTRSQVFEVSSLGLVEMTRKRVSEGLLDAFSEPCPNCDGRGIVITHEID